MDKRLLWLAVGAFAASTMAFVFAGLLPLVSEAHGVSISVAAHLVTAYSLAYAIGTPILATLTGAADRKRVILGALGLFLVGNIAAATSSSFAVLTASQIVMGAAAGLAFANGLGERRLLVHAAVACFLAGIVAAVLFDLTGVIFFPMANTEAPISSSWLTRLIAVFLAPAATALALAMSLPRSSVAP